MKKLKKEITTDICLECSKRGGGCCAGEFSVPITIKDICRIEKLGYKKQDFLVLKRYSKKEIIGPEKWWLNSFIDINGVKYKIHLKSDRKKCVFLKHGKGCILANNRTFFCKIYPFWIENNKIIIEKGDGIYCGVNKIGLTMQDKMKLMKENPKSIRRYFLEIKKDCINNKKEHEKIAYLLKNKF